jgi:phospholipid/cholesterol/gamma-HCH transport system substrate-binding protein
MPLDPKTAHRRELKVGALVLAALVVVALGVFFIGKDDRLFGRKAKYHVRFESVTGLSEGSPVQLDGVVVGTVKEVNLPVDIKQNEITVWLQLDRRYAGRIRGDSAAKIKTLGLLGDRYIAVNSGTPESPQIPIGGEIPTAEQTNIDQLVSSGEDVMQNVVQISHSLSHVLDRMDKGEGLLGKLTTDSPEAESIGSSLQHTAESVKNLADKIEHGQGPLGRLIDDKALGDQFAQAVTRLNGTLGKLETGKGALPALLDDPATKQKVDATLDGLVKATESLSVVADDLRSGDGLLPKLIHDPEYGKKVTRDLEQIMERLNLVATRLTEGDGTVAQLINDPEVYAAVKDILVGVNESKMLRWLIRNRQKAGIEKRYEEEVQKQGGAAEPPPDS